MQKQDGACVLSAQGAQHLGWFVHGIHLLDIIVISKQNIKECVGILLIVYQVEMYYTIESGCIHLQVSRPMYHQAIQIYI